MQFDYTNTSLVSDPDILKEGSRLVPYIEHLKDVALHYNYDEPEASLVLPADDHFLKESREMAEDYNPAKLKLVVIIGIGGSNLGTKAIYDALYGHFSGIIADKKPDVLFLDTIHHSFVSQLKTYLEYKKYRADDYVITVITKSGTTTETIMNMELLITMLPEALKRLVFITDKGSKLDSLAQQKSLPVLHIPKNVGGRYSVLSNVGLFPLTLLGFDTEQLLAGALDAREKNLCEDIMYNPAAISATLLSIQNHKGFVINDNFFFAPELESFGKWYRQLMGESIGKEGKGITPTVSIGSVDLHSMLQLYLGGPKNKYFTFYWVEKNMNIGTDDPAITEKPVFEGLVEDINGKPASFVLHAALEGTKRAFAKKGVPFSELVIQQLSEFKMGKLMQFKMLEMMYLGQLLGVNAFDQPNVEEYKEETRKFLKKQ